jgi:hypothetical protein
VSQTQQRSYDDGSYSDSANVANDGQESEYEVASITMPILTEHIVENLLNHMDAAQNEAIKAEQASRGRALKPIAYIRQMKPSQIETSALEFITDLSEDTVIRIAHASVNGPTVDPSYIDILTKLSLSSREINMKAWCSFS